MNNVHHCTKSAARLPLAHRCRVESSLKSVVSHERWWALAMLGLLTACGGGGDSTGVPVATPAAQPLPPPPRGSLDLGFGVGGKVVTDFSSDGDQAYALVVQPDGKIVIAGYADTGSGREDFALVRYNGNGELDPSFGSGGRVTASLSPQTDIATALAMQPDGKLVAAGYARATATQYDFALVRYDESGQRDPGFGNNGHVMTDFNGGSDTATALAVEIDRALQTVNNIVVAGYSADTAGNFDFAVARYHADGGLDTGFAGGKVTTDFDGDFDSAAAVAIQPDRKIIVAGVASIAGQADFALARYDENGDLDPGFGNGGKLTTDIDRSFDVPSALVLQADGKILVAGHAALTGGQGVMVLVRYQQNGDLDPSFGSGGIVTTVVGGVYDSISSLSVLAGGDIVAAGSSFGSVNDDIVILRYGSNGALDTGFGESGSAVFDFNDAEEGATAIGVQADGKIVVAGWIADPTAATQDDIVVIRVHP